MRTTRRSSQAAAVLPLQRSGLAQYLCQTVYGQTHNIVITSHNAAAPQRSMALDGVSPGFVIRLRGARIGKQIAFLNGRKLYAGGFGGKVRLAAVYHA